MNTFIIQVPSGSSSQFLRKLAHNMGWEVTVKRCKNDDTKLSKEEFYAKIDKSKQQAKDGSVGPTFNSANDLISYLENL